MVECPSGRHASFYGLIVQVHFQVLLVSLLQFLIGVVSQC